MMNTSFTGWDRRITLLTEVSYHTAIYVYTGSALLALLFMVWWLRRSWGRGWRLLLLLAGAALLLTPAYPQEGVDTLAPALVVAAFQILTDGVDSAMHALRPLAAMLALALVLTLLLRFTLFRGSRKSAPEQTTDDPDTAASA
jgi:phosphoglycerol transferase MdoB-like AlkP superfamily enzyme